MLRRIYDATWGRAFAAGYDTLLRGSEDAGLRDRRRELLAGASGRTLEIGAGTGINIELYPAHVSDLVLTEPFGPMAGRLRAKLPAGRADVVEASAQALPFEDATFDTVVATLVLCTVPSPQATLAEVERVLKPGGTLLFLEHVRSEEPGLARWQDRLRGPWYVFGHGCHCNRDTLAAIGSSGLELGEVQRGEVPSSPPLVRPLAIGRARARAV